MSTQTFYANLMQSNPFADDLRTSTFLQPLSLSLPLPLIFAIEGRAISQLFGGGSNAISLSFLIT